MSGNPNQATYGSLLRNDLGDWLLGYSGVIGDENILYAELYGIWVGLTTAWEKGFRKLWCETDSLEAWRLIHAVNVPSYHIYGLVLADIKEVIERD